MSLWKSRDNSEEVNVEGANPDHCELLPSETLPLPPPTPNIEISGLGPLEDVCILQST